MTMTKTKKYSLSAMCLTLLLSTSVSITNAEEITAEKPTAPVHTLAMLTLPDGLMPPPPTNQGKDLSAFTATTTISGTTKKMANQSITAKNPDENALLAKDHCTVAITGSTFTKSGDTTSGDGSNFNGQNAVILAADSNLAITDSTITSVAEGANGIFATGKDAHIKVSNVTINSTKNSSRGLDATYDGTIIADNVSIKTLGAHCAAIATDRGEGTIIATNSNLSTYGDGSPCIYSTGNITVSNSTGTAYGSEIACVEGKNSITLNSVRLRGTLKHGVMLYQSFSGDADTGTASFTAVNSTLISTANGPMFYITNTKAKMFLENTKLVHTNPILVDVTSDQWGTAGANGGTFTLAASKQQLKGAIQANAISKVAVELVDHSLLEGAVNKEHTAKNASLKLDKTSQWVLTDDSYLDSIDDADTTFSNINSNGHTLYCHSVKEDQPLSGGGRLAPI